MDARLNEQGSRARFDPFIERGGIQLSLCCPVTLFPQLIFHNIQLERITSFYYIGFPCIRPQRNIASGAVPLHFKHIIHGH